MLIIWNVSRFIIQPIHPLTTRRLASAFRKSSIDTPAPSTLTDKEYTVNGSDKRIHSLRLLLPRPTRTASPWLVSLHSRPPSPRPRPASGTASSPGRRLHRSPCSAAGHRPHSTAAWAMVTWRRWYCPGRDSSSRPARNCWPGLPSSACSCPAAQNLGQEETRNHRVS